ncbi:hypothetical protein GCM10027417_00760 [Glutamicibacter endophyticus]
MRLKSTAAATLTSVALLLGSASLAQAAPTDLPSVEQSDFSDPSSLIALINPTTQLSPEDYVPENLVTVPGSSDKLRADAAEAVEQLIADARAAGHPIKLISAYRSYNRQATLFAKYQNQYGTAYAERISARPGTSEHQLGLAADVGYSSGKCQLHACFGDTPAGLWVAKHAVDYGLIIRYPEGEEATTGYKYEPWHVRYIGTEHAQAMEASKVSTFEEYIDLLKGQAKEDTSAEDAEKAGKKSESSKPAEPKKEKAEQAESTTTRQKSSENSSIDDLLVLRFLPPFRDWSFGF